MIPVMLAGTLLYGKRYSGVEYFCAMLIAGAQLRLDQPPPPRALRPAPSATAEARRRHRASTRPLPAAGGISLFALTKDSGHVRSKLLAPNARLGYGLVFFNLGADGVTNALQDRARAQRLAPRPPLCPPPARLVSLAVLPPPQRSHCTTA